MFDSIYSISSDVVSTVPHVIPGRLHFKAIRAAYEQRRLGVSVLVTRSNMMGTHWSQCVALFSTAFEAQNLRHVVTRPCFPTFIVEKQ